MVSDLADAEGRPEVRVTPRYAIYGAPAPDTSLWRFGSAAIGYDAATGTDLPVPEGPPFDDPSWAELAAQPRRYGFHATLKAPFRLAEGSSESDLLAHARAFADTRRTFDIPRLELAALGRFLALVPAAPTPELDGLAADCVRAFDGLQAPVSDAERARRLASPLSARQIDQLDRWGYPHVFDDFRFHMTLTGSLPADRLADIHAALMAHYTSVEPGLSVDAVVVFRQAGPDARFRILERCPFTG